MTDHGRGTDRSLARQDSFYRWWDDVKDGRLAGVSRMDWEHAEAIEEDKLVELQRALALAKAGAE